MKDYSDTSNAEQNSEKPLNDKGEASMRGDPYNFKNVDDIEIYEFVKSIAIDPDKSNEEKYKEFGDFVNSLSEKDKKILGIRGYVHDGQTDILGPNGEVITFKKEEDSR